jgi:type II secretory pathway predicted ATPase ExeA
VPAAISAADELKTLWAASSTKDAFRRQNIQPEFVPATEENTKALEQHLLEEDVEDPPVLEAPAAQKTKEQSRGQKGDGEKPRFILRLPIRQIRERAALEEAMNPRSQKRRRKTTTPSRR